MAAGSTNSTEIASVWTRPTRERRDQPALSRDQIVAQAIALLDEEGFDALSMRKLGARLGAGATSLYTHVANKDELLELVVDQVIGEVPCPAPDPARWRETAHEQADGLRATLLAHPWITIVFSNTALTYLGPNMMRLTEGMLAIVEAGGFDDAIVDVTTNTLFRFIVGSSANEAALLMTIARSGLPPQDWVDRVMTASAAASAGFPRLHRRYVDQRSQVVAEATTGALNQFSQAIDLILDGAETRRG
ncbi:TetR/AcrR family transcriptional regulator [Nocardia asteroides]|uniref:TetR family transcriptional regulator n=1 Tax=Nocardia asteroides NBRC 15531 TaxID=1110697 RepID=U5ED50_NOCAS|nr:TetR/AcrR family transcriptional regulator C-terminal domain-containing protein [Nocardia asteroides]UGT49568.1 TetR/AcrR family transcriptional regulator C-terminal domain-containing protein [Nocardia asteroides]GAD84346.1 putative TetR family transcriptional regulator [Nocardia asteroides NBRC 15531]SFL94813.1 transcriptional regulator, TetR family [Nocardia asteroides]VEG37781.1 Tetracycline repressor protein class E [Nocardia asteroides]